MPHAHEIEVIWCTVYLHWRIEESMTQKRVKFCYGANGKAATPCWLSVTGCTGIVADELNKIQGSHQWSRVHACRIEVVWCPVYLLFAYRRIHDTKHR